MTEDKECMFVEYTVAVVHMIHTMGTSMLLGSIYNKNCIATFYKHCTTFPSCFKEISIHNLVYALASDLRMISNIAK